MTLTLARIKAWDRRDAANSWLRCLLTKRGEDRVTNASLNQSTAAANRLVLQLLEDRRFLRPKIRRLATPPTKETR